MLLDDSGAQGDREDRDANNELAEIANRLQQRVGLPASVMQAQQFVTVLQKAFDFQQDPDQHETFSVEMIHCNEHSLPRSCFTFSCCT
mmetsp:Transcript_5121/g.10446  ORF Transcript_5121/g.10446 Transcript_5121/m.10446 type:complete len:88 (-) Transcript_5121:76-339(-)